MDESSYNHCLDEELRTAVKELLSVVGMGAVADRPYREWDDEKLAANQGAAKNMIESMGADVDESVVGPLHKSLAGLRHEIACRDKLGEEIGSIKETHAPVLARVQRLLRAQLDRTSCLATFGRMLADVMHMRTTPRGHAGDIAVGALAAFGTPGSVP